MYTLDPSETQSESSPVYERTVELEGVAIRYRLRFLQRQASWYLDLMDSDGVPLLVGLRLAPGVPVNWRHLIPGLPPGWFFLEDPTGQSVPCETMDALGSTHFLMYATAAEVDALPALASSLPTWMVVGTGGGWHGAPIETH